MAEPETTASPKIREGVKLANSGRGARTFFDSERQPQIIRPGETWEGAILDADYESLRDLEAGDEVAGAADASTNEHSVTDFEPLDGKNKEQLLAIATREGYNSIGADATEDELREAIEAARERSKAFADDLSSLKKSSRAKLLEVAKKESVAVETDDNRDQLAVKIAEARRAKAE